MGQTSATGDWRFAFPVTMPLPTPFPNHRRSDFNLTPQRPLVRSLFGNFVCAGLRIIPESHIHAGAWACSAPRRGRGCPNSHHPAPARHLRYRRACPERTERDERSTHAGMAAPRPPPIADLPLSPRRGVGLLRPRRGSSRGGLRRPGYPPLTLPIVVATVPATQRATARSHRGQWPTI